MSLRGRSECSHTGGTSSAAVIALLAAQPGLRLSVYRLVVTASAPTTVALQDSSGVGLSQQFAIGNKALVINTSTNGDPWWMPAAGLGVQLVQTAAATIGVDIWYTSATVPFVVPAGGTGQYVAEDNVSSYVAEDGVSQYVTET